MKRAMQIYAAFLAGVLASAALAYWYYVQHMEDDGSQ